MHTIAMLFPENYHYLAHEHCVSFRFIILNLLILQCICNKDRIN
jgi:hypothetical protein